LGTSDIEWEKLAKSFYNVKKQEDKPLFCSFIGSKARLPASSEDKKENEESLENLCIVCYTNTPNIVIMDCGHSSICIECA